MDIDYTCNSQCKLTKVSKELNLMPDCFLSYSSY